MKKKVVTLIAVVLCLGLSLALLACKDESREVISYSLYPYLINYDYCKECIEEEWAELHPDVDLQITDYDCYYDGKPEGIDVIMYDAVLESYFVEEGYVAPLNEGDIDNIDDFFDYTLEDTRIDGKLYGIPAFLCSEFFIYDKSDETSAKADSIYDLEEINDDILMHEVVDYNYSLIMDVNADRNGRYIIDEEISDSEEIIGDMKSFCNEEYIEKSAYDVADAYDAGTGVGYFGYSETLSTLENRFSQSGIKMLSYSRGENIPLFYEDIVGISPDVSGEKKELCLDLMNMITSPEMMEKLALNGGSCSYLIFPRDSMYKNIIEDDSIYQCLYEYVTGENNHIIRYPASFYQEN